jgi:hypothetical protein
MTLVRRICQRTLLDQACLPNLLHRRLGLAESKVVKFIIDWHSVGGTRF